MVQTAEGDGATAFEKTASNAKMISAQKRLNRRLIEHRSSLPNLVYLTAARRVTKQCRNSEIIQHYQHVTLVPLHKSCRASESTRRRVSRSWVRRCSKRRQVCSLRARLPIVIVRS